MALDKILVKIPVCLGTRQFFELLEDSVGMTSCLVFLPYLFYGLPVGFSALFFPSPVSLVTVQFSVPSAGARRFTAFVGWSHRLMVVNLLRPSAFLALALMTVIFVGLLV